MSEPINVTPALPNADGGQKLLIVLCHAAPLLGIGLILPVIVYLVTKQDRTVVRAHAAEAFNFQLSYALWAIACIPFMIIGIGALMAFVVGAAVVILSIIAIVKAANDEPYAYPATLRLLGRN